ncbi:hypothetical protein MASR2M117_22350 [Paludibacter sp.]
MKKNILNILVILIVLASNSCEKKEPFVYKYESAPVYTWGYAQFWGQHYVNYEVEENVLSLSLFTEGLYLDKNNSLNGNGQYLFLDDIFVQKGDTVFPEGEYLVLDSIGAKIISPGKLYEVDGIKKDIGAYIYFIEKNENFTKRKFIKSGKMTVTKSDKVLRFEFDFVLDDKSELKGYYITSKLIIYDESVSTKSDVSRFKINTQAQVINFKTK